MPHIVSKLAAGMDYVTYSKGPNGKQVPDGHITVKGGADVADKRTLLTPEGVVTSVSNDELKQLRSNPLFKVHEASGALLVTDKKPEPAKAAADLQRDESSQLTPQDYEALGKTPPETGEA